MIRQKLGNEWSFQFTSTVSNEQKATDNTIVNIPHDFSIIQKRNPLALEGACTGFFPGGYGKYNKKIFVPKEWEGKAVFLEFEGIYMNSTILINHQIVAQHPNGYTGFCCDLTAYLKYGQDNILDIKVNNSAYQNTRWYSGSGVYRHVWLMIGEKLHIKPWGVFVTTPAVSPSNSTILVKTKVNNLETEDVAIIVRSTLLEAGGVELAVSETEINAKAQNLCEVEQSLKISTTNLWSMENPYLYSIKSEILKDGKVVDSTSTAFGIRFISFSAKQGFLLNGVSTKLKGGCVHHDCGPLGAASYDRAEERKVELLKENGFNAIRCAHNPPAPAFLDACDRIGMLVIYETFDVWNEEKNINDYSMFFKDWWQRDLTDMITRDRNHPSIIMWCTGNEVSERDGRSEGYEYAHKLSDFIRELDNTRAITNAVCNISLDSTISGLDANIIVSDDTYNYFGERTAQFVEPLDVVGYNYLDNRYESDGVKYPDRVICSTESFASQSFEYWEGVEKNTHVIGDFVWTAIDYIGEAGIGHIWYNGEKGFCGAYPWHLAYTGDIDICGFKRPQSCYRDCIWGRSKAPYIAVYNPKYYGVEGNKSPWAWNDVVSSWTWEGFEGKNIAFEVYCQNSEVEVFQNDKSLGRKVTGKANKYIATFETVYTPGTLLAVAYENGKEVSRTALKTVGAPAMLLLKSDRTVLKAEYGDLAYVTVEVLDCEGNVAHYANNKICFVVEGVGTLVAVGTGNPVSEEMYVGNERSAYEGRVLAIVRSNGQLGEIKLTVSSEDLVGGSIIVQVGEK